MKLLLLGAGGHTRSLINTIHYLKHDILGIFDNNFQKDEMIFNHPILGTEDDLLNKLKQSESNWAKVVISVGELEKRKLLTKTFDGFLLKKNLIHPQALIEKNTKLGIGNQILAKTYLNAETQIGNHNLINTGAILEHEVRVGNHNHISIGALLAGRVTVGNNCFIGAGVVIINNLTIADNVIIGANSTVVQDITDPGTYVGNPTRKIK